MSFLWETKTTLRIGIGIGIISELVRFDIFLIDSSPSSHVSLWWSIMATKPGVHIPYTVSTPQYSFKDHCSHHNTWCWLSRVFVMVNYSHKAGVHTVKLVMFACSKYCVFFIFSFMRVLINATPPDVRYLKQKGQIYACLIIASSWIRIKTQ